MATIKERIWNGSKYVEIDAGTVDGMDSLEFEAADPEIQKHIKSPHASIATMNSNRADIDAIKNSGYLKGDDGLETEGVGSFVYADFLGGNAPGHYAVKTQVDSAIGQIAVDRGYLNSKNVNQANVDTLTSNGKYINMYGMPCTGTWVVDVISNSSIYLTQYASCIYDSAGLGYTGKKLIRDNLGGT